VSIVYALGERLLDLGDLLLHAIDDGPGVLAHEHHHDAHDRLAAAVAGDRALADHRRELDRADVVDMNGGALRSAARTMLFEVLHLLNQALTADQILLALVRDVAAADVAVVVLERLEHVARRESVGDEAVRARWSPGRSSARRRMS
jgi:hypothetical protein